MATDAARLELLEWDSHHFGFGVARVAAAQLAPDEAQLVRLEAIERGITCCYFLARADDHTSWAAAIAAGFLPIDVRLELVAPLSTDELRENADVRSASASDADMLAGLSTNEIFRDSRFVRDERFPSDRVRGLFQLWATRALAEGFVLYCREGRDEQIRAFIAATEHGATGRIELLAVAPGAQGKGSGTALIRAALAAFARRGLTEARVVTQGSNVAAQRAYQKSGFVTASCHVWFHLWL